MDAALPVEEPSLVVEAHDRAVPDVRVDLVGDDLGHRAMIPESPAFSNWDIASDHRGFDLPPSSVSREADHSISNACTGTAALAGRVGVCRRADRNAPSGRRAAWQ
jgi:hypothetical protein